MEPKLEAKGSGKRSAITTTYMLNDKLLHIGNSVWGLGDMHNLSWYLRHHICAIVARAPKTLGFVMQLSKDFKQTKSFKIFYWKFVRSHLEYAGEEWNSFHQKYMDRIENIQRRFVRYFCFHQWVPYQPELYLSFCKKYRLLPLTIRREIDDDCSLVVIFFGNEIDSFELLSKSNLNSPSRTRYDSFLCILFVSTQTTERILQSSVQVQN